MKTIQKIIFTLIAAVLLIEFTGCLRPSIKGKWIIKIASNERLSSYTGLSFDSKGYYQWVHMMMYNAKDHPVNADMRSFDPGWTQHFLYQTNTGSYTIDGDQILMGNDSKKPDKILKFRLQGDTLILISPNGEESVYTRVQGKEFPWITKTPPPL